MVKLRHVVQEAKKLIYKKRPRHLEKYDNAQHQFIKRHTFKQVMKIMCSRDEISGSVLRQATWTSRFICFLYDESDTTFYHNVPGYTLLKEGLRAFPATHLCIRMNYSSSRKTLTMRVYFLILNVLRSASAA